MESATRTKNFSTEEISVLLKLVHENINILECKTTGRVRPDQKQKAWENVADSFNSVCSGAPRSEKILRTKYANLKAEMKKRSADQKKYPYGTGGGPYREQADSDFDKILSEILPEKQVQGMVSKYDNDFLSCEDLGNSVSSNPQQRNATDEDCVFNDIDSLASTKSKRIRTSSPKTTAEEDFEPWEQNTSMHLKTPKNKKLCIEKGNRTQTSWAKLAEIKSKWTERKLKQEIEFAKIEHSLRVTQMRETHELQKQFAYEKHTFEMRILQDQLKKN